jgi:hypothetical protein
VPGWTNQSAKAEPDENQLKNARTATQRRWRFMQLTLFIGAWMLLSPLLHDRWIVHLLLQVFLLNAVLVTLWANPGWAKARRLVLVLWGVSLAGSLLGVAPVGPGLRRLAGAAEVVSLMPLLALLAVGILRFVFNERRLTADGLFAPIAVYLIIALLFAQVYLLMLAWNPACFDLPIAASERLPHLLQSDMLYFSMITLATVGYGDILPVSETARTLAVMEATVGQFYVAIIVAVFVGMYAAQRRE